MNICLVSRELYPFQKAGIGVYINNLSRMLSKHDNEIYIITSKANSILYKSNIPNIHVFGVEIAEEGTISNEPCIAYSLAVQKKLYEVCEKNNIDIVEFCDYFGEAFFPILFKRYRKMYINIPFLMKLHTPTYECRVANKEKLLEDILTRQEDSVISNCDFVYAISNKMKESIEKRLGIDNIRVMSNIIELPTDNNIDYEVEMHEKYILYVGRVEKRKGIDFFIESAIKYLENNDKKIKFVIIGNDTKNEGGVSQKFLLEAKIKASYKENFIWLESISQEKLVRYYKNAYVSIFPSIYEGFGNVCVEAMQCGSPVIVSSDTGLEEIVSKNKYGITFENSDSEDLYQKLVYILENPVEREKFKALSKKRGKMFTGNFLYQGQISYYKELIDYYKKNKKSVKKSINEEIMLETCEKSLLNSKEQKRIINEWDKSEKIICSLKEECKKRQCEEERILAEWKSVSDRLQQETNEKKMIKEKCDEYKEKCDEYKEKCNEYKEKCNEYKEYIKELEENLSLFYRVKRCIKIKKNRKEE